MVEVKPLVIGDLIAKVPVIQGGMGVGVSLSSLAGAVASEGGIGVISTAQIGYREPDFDTDPSVQICGPLKLRFRRRAGLPRTVSWVLTSWSPQEDMKIM